MRIRTNALVSLCLVTSSLAIASPKDAHYAEDAEDLFWFVVTADVHVGQNLWGGSQDTDHLAWVVGEAFETISPRLVVLCGDLVDATHGGLIPKQQSADEWAEYRFILDAHGMTPDVLLDLPGNHDQYCDKGLSFYRKFSVQGSADDQTQHSLVHEGPSGFYHFLAVATPGNDGACWPADNAGLDAAELDFIREALAAKAGARLHFVFGHHGVRWGESNKVGEGSAEFRQLLQKYEVAAYFWGHTHAYYNAYHDKTLFFNVRSLGKSDDRNVALVAVDHDSLAVRAFTARKWPFVLVTAPADRSLGGGNPYAYTVPKTWASAPVRALVFSVPAPKGVRFRVDDGVWQDMTEVAPSVYQGAMDATVLAEGEHRLRVRADPWSDADHEIRFLVGVTTCSNGLDDDGDGLTDYPADRGCANPADGDESEPPDSPEFAERESVDGLGSEPTPEEMVASEEEIGVSLDEVTDAEPGFDASLERGEPNSVLPPEGWSAEDPGVLVSDIGETAPDAGPVGEDTAIQSSSPGGGCVHRPIPGRAGWALVLCAIGIGVLVASLRDRARRHK